MPDRLDDQFDREEFYRGPDPEFEDEGEYELEPPDEEILARERKRAEESVELATRTVELRKLEQESDAIGDLEAGEVFEGLEFKFGTKHLLIGMAILAVFLGLGMTVGFLPTFIVLTFVVVASSYAFIRWKENRRETDIENRRREINRHYADQEKELSDD